MAARLPRSHSDHGDAFFSSARVREVIRDKISLQPPPPRTLTHQIKSLGMFLGRCKNKTPRRAHVY